MEDFKLEGVMALKKYNDMQTRKWKKDRERALNEVRKGNGR